MQISGQRFDSRFHRMDFCDSSSEFLLCFVVRKFCVGDDVLLGFDFAQRFAQIDLFTFQFQFQFGNAGCLL